MIRLSPIEQELWARAYASAYDAECRVVDTEVVEARFEETDGWGKAGWWESVTSKETGGHTTHFKRRVGSKDAIRRVTAAEAADDAIAKFRSRL